MGDATGYHIILAKKRKNHDVEIAQLKVQTSSGLKCGSKRALHERMPTNLNELRQCCKEEWAKIM